MLDVKNDNLVIEEKGIYSIEKFIIARRLMYWQVYLHKTVISAENMLIQLLMRAKYLVRNSENIYISSNLKKFLCNDIKLNDFKVDNKLLNNFSQLDDSEIYSGLKYWSQNEDFVLSKLSNDILNRNILKIKVQKNIFNKKHIKLCITKMINKEKISKEEAEYFIFSDKVSNRLYSIGNSNINILFKNGEIKDLSKSSDQFNLVALSKTINKYFLCSPKEYIVN